MLELWSHLGREDGLRIAGSIQESDIELDRDIRDGWDLVGTRSSGEELASLSPTISLQIHTLLHCEQTQPLSEGTLYLLRGRKTFLKWEQCHSYAIDT